jgi:hypothetical protein
MVGYVQDAVANALSNWDALKAANIMPVRATDGASVVVNTPLPAIAVHINGTDGQGNTYFGGGIRQYFELTLHVLLPVTNYTFSKDKGLQAAMLDLSDDVIRCMEQTRLLDELKSKHDFNMQFDRMETDTTYGTQGSLSVAVDVHKVIYNCDVEFDPKDEAFKRYAELKKVIMDNNGINESIIQ